MEGPVAGGRAQAAYATWGRLFIRERKGMGRLC